MITQVSHTINKVNIPVSSSGVVTAETVKDVVTKDNHRNGLLVKTAAIGGSALTTLAFLAMCAKRDFKGPLKFKNLFKIDFEHPLRCIGLATSATVGGLLGGIAVDKKEQKKHKLKEAIHQFLGNILTPIGIVGITVALINKKNLSPIKKKFYAGLAAVGGVGIGVTLGNKAASKVNESIFKEKDERKVKLKDFGIHIDDVMTWLALTSKGTAVKSFIGKVMPVIFLLCGYEAGASHSKSRS